MDKKEAEVFRPEHLTELLSIYARHPDAVLMAGGTTILAGKLPQTDIIDLTTVEELKKIRRTDRFMDIGPALSIARILSTGRRVIPGVLYDALSSMGNLAIRNITTLGGSICGASPYSSPLPALYALEARLELRSSTTNRWLPISRFILDRETIDLMQGEILTAIRVPFEDWNVNLFKKVNTQGSHAPPAITFCGLARILKQEIQDFRFAIGSVNRTVLRRRKLETPLVGHKMPLAAKDFEILKTGLAEVLSPIQDSFSTDRYRNRTVFRIIRWFLDELNQLSNSHFS